MVQPGLVQALLDLLEGYSLVRRLAPYHANLGKRLVKSPKAYIRDSGMLRHLLGLRDMDSLITSPARGNSFEGFMIEQIIALARVVLFGTKGLHANYLCRREACFEKYQSCKSRCLRSIAATSPPTASSEATDCEHSNSSSQQGRE